MKDHLKFNYVIKLFKSMMTTSVMGMVWSHIGNVDVVIPTGYLIIYYNKTMIISSTIPEVWSHLVESSRPGQLIS